ncbi:MAG: tetratricopeptide repeat protein [Candidatus Tectomicrobia bacterium]|uniref:Tetratricopeptide repeat protein n=1 Tax=Tectimicrobiota bacterium TaxID=2528274 RepID=A0A932GQH3_UNCTE|nr:tetratricopeptide repeat protein [Candidatus Tectomicrobia bacterium]
MNPLAREYLEDAYEFHIRGEIEEAIDLYKKSLEIEPSAQAYTFLGWAYSHQGNLEEAIKRCFQAIELDPEFGNPWNDIGAYYIQQGRLEEAIPYLKQAMTAKNYEAYHYPHCNLGRIYLLQHKYLEATAEFRKALEIEPGYKLAAIHLARLQGMMN